MNMIFLGSKRVILESLIWTKVATPSNFATIKSHEFCIDREYYNNNVCQGKHSIQPME
jgi:hypothetical protein